MARSWLIDIEGFAKKVKRTTLSSADQIKDCGAYRECPNCHWRIDNSDVSSEWPGFPLGIKFDPSDVELLDHLAAKCGLTGLVPTYMIFSRTMMLNLSTLSLTSTICIHCSVIEDGVHKGYKKIMVLYIRSEKESKSYKSDWKMHQYHLGTGEDEKNGEYVVSKIFYKHNEKNEEKPMAEESDNITSRTSPKTPKPNPPNPLRAGKSVGNDDNIDETALLSSAEDAKSIPVESHTPQSETRDQDNADNSAWLVDELQTMENCEYDGLDDILLCKEILDSSALFDDFGLNSITSNDLAYYENKMTGNCNVASETSTSVLDTLELDTAPDYDLSTLTFCSQDSILDWLDWL